MILQLPIIMIFLKIDLVITMEIMITTIQITTAIIMVILIITAIPIIIMIIRGETNTINIKLINFGRIVKI